MCTVIIATVVVITQRKEVTSVTYPPTIHTHGFSAVCPYYCVCTEVRTPDHIYVFSSFPGEDTTLSHP